MEQENDELLPKTVHDLIEKLNKIFPEQCARLGQSQEEIWYASGQRSVINWLLELQDRDNNN